MQEKQEQVDYFAHQYEADQNVELNGNSMLLIARFLTEVIQKETDVFASFTYPIDIKEVKNDAGDIIRVDYDLKEHNKESFMMTASNDNGAQLGLTSIGVKASQILSALLWTHEQNIKKGLTKVQEELDEDRAFRA